MFMLKALFLTVALLATTPAFAERITLSGEVTYRERIALPDNAVLSIDLVDLALPDRPRVSVSAPTGAGQVPLSFTFTVEDSMILPQHHYALNARIEAGDFVFRNNEPYPVAPLVPGDPIVILTTSVATEEPPAADPEEGVVALPILDVTWQATSVGGVDVPPGVDVSLLIGPDMRAGGVGGCNSFFGQVTITGDSFAIGDLGRTMRSCGQDRNLLEQSYFEALRASRLWTIDGDTLTLLDAAGKPTIIYER
jgi:putative lipoprotein